MKKGANLGSHIECLEGKINVFLIFFWTELLMQCFKICYKNISSKRWLYPVWGINCVNHKLFIAPFFPNVLFKKYVKKKQTKNMPARNAHLYYVNAKLLPVGIFFKEIFACLHHHSTTNNHLGKANSVI